MKNLFVFALLLAFFQPSYSQIEENQKKNSFGLDLGIGNGNPNFGMTYRRFSQDSKYNLRVNFNLGGNTDYGYYGSNDYMFFNTNDTALPLIGVSRNRGGFGNYQRLEIGVEKSFTVWKLNLIWGVDATVGHRRYEAFQSIIEAGIDTIEENGFSYFDYGAANNENPWENINELNTVFNYVTGGVNLRLGFKLNISPQFYFTSFVTLASELELIVNEDYRFKTELYKEHLVARRGGDSFNFYTLLNVGVHYKF
ncbi:MAG: hypothetical protein ABF264_05220 [Flavobacteriales bacterium]